jgi:predicted nicotinamide N-methyase
MTETLSTNVGEIPLEEYRLRVGDREWSVLHTGALISFLEEQTFLGADKNRLPYGVALWPASIALAHDLAESGAELRGKRILELGAGTGLPGIVASAYGARVVQTDRAEAALRVCRMNGERNRAVGIEYRLADWTLWDDTARYDLIIGGDILYAEAMHEHLERIFESNLAEGGRILAGDPFRLYSIRLLEKLQAAGWRITVSKWSIGEGEDARGIGVFELTRG